LFNIGFAVIFSFGPSMTRLVDASAGSAVSIVLWVAVFSVRFGGDPAVSIIVVGLQPDCCGATTSRRRCSHLMQPLLTPR
jgi:hypothetical protein